LKKSIYLALISLALISCANPPINSDVLSQSWESRGELAIPESVIYDRSQDSIFVSNVNSTKSSNPWSNNGGFISKLNAKGEVIKLKWATGLKAPKGIVSANGHLYASDLDSVVDIDISTGKIVHIFQAPKGIERLNDIAYDANRKLLFVSDSKTKQLFSVTTDGKFTKIYDRENSPKAEQNGLLVDGDNLIMQGEMGKLKALNLTTQKVKIVTYRLGVAIDGVTKYRDKGYIVSTWIGGIFFIDKSGKVEAILGNKFHTADIFYSKELDLLLVPNFAHKILAYKVKL
jgi:hypothetical protein